MNKFIVFCLIFPCAVINAQSKYEILLKGGGGLSTLNYATTAKNCTQENGLGWQAGIGYSYFFFSEWGIGTGIELAQCNSRFRMGDFVNRYMTTDKQRNDFEFRSNVEKYLEKQSLLQVQIPLMMQYQTGAQQRLYAAAGVKVGIPVKGSYTNTGGNIINSGYYDDEKYEYTTQKFMGFGKFDAKKADGELELNMSYFVSAEFGVKFNTGALSWKFGGRGAIYVGVFIDYGLNSIAPKIQYSSKFIEYIPDMYDFTMNSVFYSQDGDEQPFISNNKIHPLSVGIKLKLSYGKGSSLHKDSYPFFRHLRDFKMSQ